MTDTINAAPLSVFMITLNEAEHVGNCIIRVRNLADEIIVMDSGSTDGTQKIAADHGAVVIHRDFDGFGQQKFAAEQLCRNNWVLNLDPDEYLLPDSITEIAAFLSRSDLETFDGARLKIIPVYPGRERPRLWAHYQNRIRLYDKRKLNFPTHPSHDSIEVDDEKTIHQLEHGASHYTFTSFEALEDKMRERCRFYFAIEKQPSRGISLLRGVIEFPFAFFKSYVLRRQFTGGWDGLRLSWLHAKYRFLRIAQRVLGRTLV